MNLDKKQRIKEATRKILALEAQRDKINEEIHAEETKLDKLLETAVFQGPAALRVGAEPIRERANGKKNGKSNEALLGYLEEHHNKIDYGETAKLLYGTDNRKNRTRVQSRLYWLEKQGKVKKSTERKVWELVA